MQGTIYKHINSTSNKGLYIMLLNNNIEEDSSYVILFDNLMNFPVGDQIKVNYIDYIESDCKELANFIITT